MQESLCCPGSQWACDYFTIKLTGQMWARHGGGPQGTSWEHFPLTWGTWEWGQNELWRYTCFGYDPSSTSDNE